MNPQEVFGKDYQPFEEIDPFNPRNTVAGYISRASNEYYGALIIEKVNNKFVTPQLIMGTPKMHYPFDSGENGSRNYHFPIAKSIDIYEKLDGTNILAYSYTDDLYRYFTYKTRLRPFLASSRFGDFYSMWTEIAGEYFPEIQRRIIDKDCNLSFELYGSRNPHLVAYPNSLDFALLFGVTNTGKILSPDDLKITSLPNVKKLKTIDKDYVWNYEELRKELQDGLTKTEDNYYKGMEGTVWYLHTIDSKCIQLKCKPETIEAIHFSAGAGGLSRNIILATVWNSLENTDNPTLDFVKQLLIEEFKPEVIEAHRYLIQNCIDFVIQESEFREEVKKRYKALGKNILLEKAEVMRELSKHYPKKDMQKVFAIVKEA